MKSSFRIILFLLLIAPINEVSAQINFRKGWIITMENDTVQGFIKEYGINRSMKVCRFKENKISEPVNYSPDQILSYQIEGGNYYSSGDYFHKGELNRVFAEVLLDGKLKLSHYGKNREMAFYLEMEEGYPVGLSNVKLNITRKSDYGYMAYSNTTEVKVPVYRDTLFSLFQDSRKAQGQLSNVKYTKESLISISKAYINETCEGEDCISYEKDFRRSRDRFGIYSGLQTIQEDPREASFGYEYNITYPIGLFYNISIPHINERFSFQVELVYRKMIYYEILDNSGLLSDSPGDGIVIGMPLMVNYRILWNRFSPTIGAGTELGLTSFADQRKCWFADLGVDFELTRGISLFTRVRHQQQKYRVKTDRHTNSTGFEYASQFTALHIGLKF